MLHRMALIRDFGGNGPFIRTWIVLIASIVFPVLEWSFFGGITGSCAVVTLTIAGWYFRNSIMEMGEFYNKYSTLILFVYGVVLFLTKRLGVGLHGQLIVITIATVVIFNLNFWSISEAALFERNELEQSDRVVDLTESAVETFKQYLAGSQNSYIRLSVIRNEGTGYLYDLKIQELPAGSDDRVDTSDGFTLAIPCEDAALLEGSTISWETQADGTEGFRFDNPNASSGNG